MGRDWDEPRDKGPTIEEPQYRGKKGGGKKPFIIQVRYIGPEHSIQWLRQRYEKKRTWYIYSRYKTEKARENALRVLKRRRATHWEYRIPPEIV